MTIAWKLHVSLSDLQVRSWKFVPKGGNFANILADSGVIESTRNSPGPFTIKKPSTLILKSVNIKYNGTYSFSIIANGHSTRSDVTVFVAGKCLLFDIPYLIYYPSCHQKILNKF